MKLFGGIVVLLTGALISVIAAYISVFGMTQLFNAHATVVAIMIGAIELGKLVSATWLKFYWNDAIVPKLHKFYLLVAVISTMLITSLGLFGFLSAAHLEQKAPLAGLAVESQQYETQLAQKTGENERLIKRLDQIDQNIGAFIDQGAAGRGLTASQSLKRERDQLSTQIDINNTEINKLNEQLTPLKAKSGMVEAKLGPVKYLAQIIGYGDNPEVAVQIVILMIMIPFDPLALVLVLSGMITINQWRNERKLKIDGTTTPDETEGQGRVTDSIPSGPNSAVDTSEAPILDSDTAKAVEEIPDVTEPEDPILDSDEYWDEVTRGRDTPRAVESQVTDKTVIEMSRREGLIDMLEQDPSLISDLIAVVKDLENTKTTPSDITGGTFD